MASTSMRTHDARKSLDCEFLPPLDAPETWGQPWDRQIAAALAWQEAGGNDDGQVAPLATTQEVIVPSLDDATRRALRHASDPTGSAGNALTMRSIVRMNTLLVSLRERMLQITAEASNVAIDEMSRRQSSSADASTLTPLHEDNGRRIKALARAWFDIIASAQASMSELTGLTPTGAAGALHRFAANEAASGPERRHQALAISFPDRRRSGT